MAALKCKTQQTLTSPGKDRNGLLTKIVADCLSFCKHEPY